MTYKIAVLPGDGIGPEIAAQALKVLDALRKNGVSIEYETAAVGGVAYDQFADPLPLQTQQIVDASDAVLFGAVGHWRYDQLPREKRPEQAILRLRQHLELYANLRPVTVFDELMTASSLKRELIEGLDLMIVRELIGGIYFGEPRGFSTNDQGVREAYNTLRYDQNQVERVAKVACQVASARKGRICSVDKMNVLESMQFWREVVTDTVQACNSGLELSHLYVDNAAMQLIRDPQQFDVILAPNLFGDILSDQASMLSGALGLMPSASLGTGDRGLFEPIHGSAPDIAGKSEANPVGMLLSLALLLRYSLKLEQEAQQIEKAVRRVISQGYRTPDIYFVAGKKRCSTDQMGDAIVRVL